MAQPYCPRCSAYKTAAFKLSHEIRTLRQAIADDPDKRELLKALERAERAESAMDRLRVEQASEYQVRSLEEIEEALGFDRGAMPSRGQWEQAKAIADIMADLIHQFDGELPEKYVRIALKLLERE